MAVVRFLIQDIQSGLYLTDKLMLVPKEKALAFRKEVAVQYRHRKYGKDWMGKCQLVEASTKDKIRTRATIGGRIRSAKKKAMMRQISKLPRRRYIPREMVEMLWNQMVLDTWDEKTRKRCLRVMIRYGPTLKRDYWDPLNYPQTPQMITLQEKVDDLLEWRDKQLKEDK